MPYRLIYIGLGLVGVAAIALGLAFSAEGESVVIPGPLETVYPEPGSLVPLQTTVEVDLPNGYEAQIWIDGWPITNSTFIQATGLYTWAPSPADPVITEWAPGEHTVEIRWDTYAGYPDPGSFEWTFRVG